MSIAEKIAIIGSGRIGQAIAKALIKNGYTRIIATARRKETLEKVKHLSIETTLDNEYAIKKSDIIILSVKPHHFPSIVTEVKNELWTDKIVISIMAGVNSKILKRYLKNTIVYRAMPNINAMIGESCTAISTVESNRKYDKIIENIFLTLGKVYWIPEEMLDSWTGLIGSGPAYIAEIIDGMMLGAISIGLPRDTALKAIIEMIEGTMKLLKKTNMHPIEMRDEVTTPAGTTIKGLSIIEKEGVKAALMRTVEEATWRSKEISKMIGNMIQNNMET